MDKERNKAYIDLKIAKNDFAAELRKLSDVSNPYGLAKFFFETCIIKGLYGKKIETIRKDLEVSESFSIEYYMSEQHLQMCIDSLNKLTTEASYKVNGNTLKRVGSSIKDHAESIAQGVSRKYKKQLDEQNGKSSSVYTDLLTSIKENINYDINLFEINESDLKEEPNYDELEKWYRDENGKLTTYPLPDIEDSFNPSRK